MFGTMVEDVITASLNLLSQTKVRSAQDIRNLDNAVVQFSSKLWLDIKEIKLFLFENMYRAPRVMDQREHASKVVRDLFYKFMNNPALMPKDWVMAVAADATDPQKARVVSDYIAGMTDRFAQQEHNRLQRVR